MVFATLAIGTARLLIALPSSQPPSFAAALEMRDHLVREGLIGGIACVSCAKPDLGGIRYLPKDHKDSLWPHVRQVYAATRARVEPPDYLLYAPCGLGPGRPESILAVLADIASAARDPSP